MNGIEKITARITNDSKAEIELILREANEKAEELQAVYKEKAEAAKVQAEDAARQAGQRRLSQLESSARMEAKSVILAAKQACMDEVFAKALEMLKALPDEEYVALLAEMAKKASRTGNEKIILSAADKERLGKQVAEKAGLQLADETRDMEGGLTLQDGNVEINCAFETKLRVLRESMAAEVANILFA